MWTSSLCCRGDFEPLGGPSVELSLEGMGASFQLEGIGDGGAGSSPSLQAGSPSGQRGFSGKPGAGAFTLALQRCEDGSEWTLHGLWPVGVNYCHAEEFSSTRLRAGLAQVLHQKWPSCPVHGASDQAFWQHEWLKHGTCSGLSPEAYFQKSLDLLDSFKASCTEVTSLQCNICLTAEFRPCGGPSRVRV